MCNPSNVQSVIRSLSLSQGRVIKGAYRFQAVIITFEMILGGCPELNAIDWRCVIIDEAHRLKNKNCKLLEGFKLMSLVLMRDSKCSPNQSLLHRFSIF